MAALGPRAGTRYAALSVSLSPSSRPVVLVVDDDQVNQMLLTDVCVAEGYDVVRASDGEAALEVFRSQDIDLVLLDVAMPKLDGYTVCRMMRAIRRVPVIIVSATAERWAEERAMDSGASAFMTKPFRVFELARKMRALMQPSVAPSRPPAQANHERRVAAARALGRIGGALQLRASLRKALASEVRHAVVFVRLDNEREVVENAGRTARDAVMGAICELLEQSIAGIDLYSADSNEVVAILSDAALDGALTAISVGARTLDLGVGAVDLRWAGVRLGACVSEVDEVVRRLREEARVAGGGAEPGGSGANETESP
jgi:CheY-like chemotaxis protein